MAVMKFGGTSVENADAMQNVINIIKTEKQHKIPLVVLSACAGITNKLEKIADAAADNRSDEALHWADEIQKHHETIAENLIKEPQTVASLKALIKEYIDDLKTLINGVDIVGELTARSMDVFYSYGELLSTNLLEAGLKEQGVDTFWLDARDVLITDDNFGKAQPLWDLTMKSLQGMVLPELQGGNVVVTQGFIGRNRSGKTTTLGRGGSDYSAAIFGALLKRTKIQIWTDVDGVLTCDPRLVPEAKRLKVITFNEAAELAYFGAKVLHPATIHPAVTENVPVYVKNSKRPEIEGTLITNDPGLLEGASYDGLVKSIAYKTSQSIVSIKSNQMLGAYGFLAEVFQIFANHKTPVDMISTSEVSLSLTINNTERLRQIMHDLEHKAEVDVEHDVAILCVVGDKLRSSPGVSGRIFNALKNVNIRMISQGASEINVGFVVAESDLQKAASALHHEFFTGHFNEKIFA